jgi:predicted metal-dependent enzyme (double-stranded beta helix superfamily)
MLMKADTYSVDQLVSDLDVVCATAREDRDILSAVRPLARRAALARQSWLNPRMYQADPVQGFGVHLLHEKPDHSLAIFVVSWLPHRGAPPHDHGTWAVVAGVDGDEKNTFYEREDDRSRSGYAKLRVIGEKVFGPGDVVAMPRGVIHSVVNESDDVSVSLHIYGTHVNYTERSQFDLAKNEESPFKVRMEA